MYFIDLDFYFKIYRRQNAQRTPLINLKIFNLETRRPGQGPNIKTTSSQKMFLILFEIEYFIYISQNVKRS